MKKSFVVLTAVTALAIYAGIRAYNHVPYTEDGKIPLPPGFVEESPAEFNEEEKLMIEWLSDKCVSEGIIDVKNPDGDICVETICGTEANQATGHLQMMAALKKCYAANH